MAQKRADLSTIALLVGGGLIAYNIAKDKPAPGTEGQRPTYSSQNFRDFADQLWQLFFAGAFEDEAEITRTIARMNNDADVHALIDAYGSRFQPAYLRSFTLPQAVDRFFDPIEKAALNVELIKKYIVYRF